MEHNDQAACAICGASRPIQEANHCLTHLPGGALFEGTPFPVANLHEQHRFCDDCLTGPNLREFATRLLVETALAGEIEGIHCEADVHAYLTQGVATATL